MDFTITALTQQIEERTEHRALKGRGFEEPWSSQRKSSMSKKEALPTCSSSSAPDTQPRLGPSAQRYSHPLALFKISPSQYSRIHDGLRKEGSACTPF